MIKKCNLPGTRTVIETYVTFHFALQSATIQKLASSYGFSSYVRQDMNSIDKDLRLLSLHQLYEEICL